MILRTDFPLLVNIAVKASKFFLIVSTLSGLSHASDPNESPLMAAIRARKAQMIAEAARDAAAKTPASLNTTMQEMKAAQAVMNDLVVADGFSATPKTWHKVTEYMRDVLHIKNKIKALPPGSPLLKKELDALRYVLQELSDLGFTVKGAGSAVGKASGILAMVLAAADCYSSYKEGVEQDHLSKGNALGQALVESAMGIFLGNGRAVAGTREEYFLSRPLALLTEASESEYQEFIRRPAVKSALLSDLSVLEGMLKKQCVYPALSKMDDSQIIKDAPQMSFVGPQVCDSNITNGQAAQ